MKFFEGAFGAIEDRWNEGLDNLKDNFSPEAGRDAANKFVDRSTDKIDRAVSGGQQPSQDQQSARSPEYQKNKNDVRQKDNTMMIVGGVIAFVVFVIVLFLVLRK